MRRPHLRPWAALSALSTLAAVAVLGLTAAPASAEQWWAPDTGTMPIHGHGWGHGHGMSQWGARGMADAGKAWPDILSFYYPGTTLGSDGGAIRVQLTGPGTSGSLHSNTVTVWPAGTALQVSDTGTPNSHQALYGSDQPGGAIAYRVITWVNPQGKVVQGVQRWDGSNWSVQPLPWNSGGLLAGNAVFSGPATIGMLFPDHSAAPGDTEFNNDTFTYRGTITAVGDGGTGLWPVNTLSLDDYVRGVVPYEMPTSWPAQALAAQAVAARTYGANSRGGGAWDICSTTSCQVYGGTRAETSATDAAVSATAGKVVLYNGRPAFAQFSSSNGGWTAAGSQPYLDAHADPYDADNGKNPHTLWASSLSVSAIQQAWPSIGTFTHFVLTRDGHGDWGGRVTQVALYGVNSSGGGTTLTVSGDKFRSAMGLKSTWWQVDTGPIQAKWFAMGGESGSLGAPIDGEHAVPGGRVQDFERGSIYYSSSTGAHFVWGGIQDEYNAIGGPSKLGLPTSDEVGLSNGAVSHFQIGDIYWSSSTGAHFVWGAIKAKYDALGGVAKIGYPTTDEQQASGGAVSHFQIADIYWSSQGGAHRVWGGIKQTYDARGGAGSLGLPLTDEEPTPGGVRQQFSIGDIYWSSQTGANVVWGGIRAEYNAIGGSGKLGMPRANEQPVSGGVRQQFGIGDIYWSSQTDAHFVWGGIKAKYDSLGGANSSLGLPVKDEYAVSGGAREDFQHGSLVWNSSTNQVSQVS